MAEHLIVCEGEHDNPPVIGAVEFPDAPTPPQLQAAQSGHLCGDCTDAYDFLVGEFAAGRPGISPRARPSSQAVDVALQQQGKKRKQRR